MIAGALIVVLSGLLAYANGANDISKGIATLVGSGVTNYRRAIVWGTVWTACGAAVAWVAAGAMVATFGKGLFAVGVAPSFAATIASLAGAAAWILIATRASLPVSTTHALVGAVIGAGVAAYGTNGIAWGALGTKVALPLTLSPVAAVLLTHLTTRGMTLAFGAVPSTADCVCITAKAEPALRWMPADSAVLLAATPVQLSVTRGDAAQCQQVQTAVVRLTGDHVHWLSSGAVSFARGLNDAPKIVALALAAAVLAPGMVITPAWFSALVTAGIVAGSLIAGRRVTRVLAEDLTPMDHRDGLSTNLVTASLVTVGAVYGLPMSTTHVSSSGIMGVGAARGTLNWPTVRSIVLAWILTLPAAALLGVVAYRIARTVLS